jgi:hypothetical protein
VGPRKPVVKPNQKLKAFFWDRILLDPALLASQIARAPEQEADQERVDEELVPVWVGLQEASIDVETFEGLFAQKAPAASKAAATEEKPKAKEKQSFSALDGKRSQSVGILMGSVKLSTRGRDTTRGRAGNRHASGAHLR